MKRIWDEEKVPVTFAKANFKMIFKKSNSDDPRKYRCLGMLNHCYKVLSRIILGRLTMKGEKYLQDWQAGFRQAKVEGVEMTRIYSKSDVRANATTRRADCNHIH